jgi:hypothetical protein
VIDLIRPAAADMAGTILGEKAKQRISDMADVLKELLLHTQASEFYALQLNESTDNTVDTSLAQLLVYFLSTEQLCDIKWTLVVLVSVLMAQKP